MVFDSRKSQLRQIEVSLRQVYKHRQCAPAVHSSVRASVLAAVASDNSHLGTSWGSSSCGQRRLLLFCCKGTRADKQTFKKSTLLAKDLRLRYSCGGFPPQRRRRSTGWHLEKRLLCVCVCVCFSPTPSSVTQPPQFYMYPPPVS